MFRIFLAITLFFTPIMVVEAQVPCRPRIVAGPPLPACNTCAPYYQPTIVKEVIVEHHADVVTQIPVPFFVPTYGAVSAPTVGPVPYVPALPATQQLAGYSDTNTQIIQLLQRQQVLMERLAAVGTATQVTTVVPAKPAPPVMAPPADFPPQPGNPPAGTGDGATFNASQLQDAVPFFKATCARCHSTSTKVAGKGFELLTDDGKISPSLTAKQVNRVLNRIEANTMPPPDEAGKKAQHSEATWHGVKLWGHNWFEAH